MRAAIPFDTLEYMEELRESGMDTKQAEAITKATHKAFNEMIEIRELSTKKDIKESEIALRKDIKELELAIKETEVRLTKFISENTWKTIGLIVTFQIVIAGIFTSIQYFK